MTPPAYESTRNLVKFPLEEIEWKIFRVLLKTCGIWPEGKKQKDPTVCMTMGVKELGEDVESVVAELMLADLTLPMIEVNVLDEDDYPVKITHNGRRLRMTPDLVAATIMGDEGYKLEDAKFLILSKR